LPSEKTARSSERKRIRNRSIRSATRTIVAKAGAELQKGEAQNAEPAITQAVRALDKAVTKGILHRNNAARKKSRLVTKLKKLKTS
jgi:small subunit ribosomal protein S20